MDGKALTFHLAGINNQNFIMRDEQTGSWWQQVTGEAILGPLKGRRLKPVFHDELTFAAWKKEHPAGRVLKPDPAAVKKKHYASADWEMEIAKLPVVTPEETGAPLPPRTLVLGLTVQEESRAYAFADLRSQGPINDRLGGVPVLLAVGEDGRSVRAFERTLDGRPLEFFAPAGTASWGLLDSATGSRWDFTGRAVEGPLAGKQLLRVAVLPDYWFDWKIYHPGTDLYRAGLRKK